MPSLHKRDYTPAELAEILCIVISEYEEMRKHTYKSSERTHIDKKLKALKQLEKRQRIEDLANSTKQKPIF